MSAPFLTRNVDGTFSLVIESLVDFVRAFGRPLDGLGRGFVKIFSEPDGRLLGPAYIEPRPSGILATVQPDTYAKISGRSLRIRYQTRPDGSVALVSLHAERLQ